jgi:hypothetical protein
VMAWCYFVSEESVARHAVAVLGLVLVPIAGLMSVSLAVTVRMCTWHLSQRTEAFRYNGGRRTFGLLSRI